MPGSAQRSATIGVESCEIVFTTLSIPINLGYVSVASTSLGFQAEGRSSGRSVVVATVDDTDEISEEELESRVIEETPERRAIVEQLVRKLKASDWRYVGKGAAWFSCRFQR